MKRILFHGLSWGWLLLALALVLLAISITVIRLAAPMGANYHEEIANQISKLIDRPVEIESIDFSLHGFRPVAIVSGVKVLSRKERRTVFDFESMKLVLNPWQSLLKRKLIPSDITLAGSHLGFERHLDGRITVSGFQLGSNGAMTGERLDLLTNLTFKLKDIEVYWQDYPLGTSYRFRTGLVQVRATPDSIDLQGEISPPQGMGRDLNISLNIRGPVTNYQDWDGSFHINAPGINLPLLPLEFGGKIPVVEDGQARVRIWGQWRGQQLTYAVGDLNLDQVLLRPVETGDSKIPPMFRLDSLQTRFKLQTISQGWQVDLDRLRIDAQEQRWPESSLSFSSQRFDDQWLWRGSLGYLDVATVSSFLAVLQAKQAETAELLQQIQPQGGVYNLMFSWWQPKAGFMPQYAASGEFTTVSWQDWKGKPGLDGLDGTFDFDQDDGKMLVSSQGLEVSYPKLFTNKLWVDSFYSELDWQNPETGKWNVTARHLEIQNQDLRLTADAALKKDNETDHPHLTLTSHIPDLRIDKVKHYLPINVMPEKTGKWLTQALVTGQASNGKFSYEGYLSKQDFKDGVAVMLASCDVDNAELDYKKDWPLVKDIKAKVSFKNASMHIASNQANVYDNQAQAVTADIEDFYRSELKLDIKTRGQLTGMLKYLREIPVSRGMEGLLDATESSGESDLALKLAIPLSKKIKNRKTAVDGQLQFNENSLALPEHNVEIGNIKGLLNFTENSYQADNIAGVFRDSEVLIDVATNEGAAVDINVTGLFTPDQLLPGNVALQTFTNGQSRWYGTIKVPSRKQREEKQHAHLYLKSALQGIKIDLPAPLGKISLVERDFLLDMPLGRGEPVIDFSYAPVLFGKLQLSGKGERLVLDKGVVSLSEQTLKLPDNGLDIIGHWPLLDTSSWLQSLAKVPDSTAKKTAPDKIRRVSISLSEWFFAGQQFSNVNFTAARNANSWRANVEGDAVKGFVRIPMKNFRQSTLEGDFERLYLKKSPAGGEPVSPRNLPVLKFSVDDFRWQATELGKLDLVTVKDLWGMQITQLDLTSADLTARSTGQWRQDDQGRQHTRLDFDIQGTDLGKLLTDLGISKTLQGGQGSLKGVMRWADAPYRLAFPSWNGEVNVLVNEGSFNQVNPGFGRILGLLNVDQLPKRLSLEFKDVSSEGLRFDELGGLVTLVDGEAYVQNFKIDSASADMSLSGKINLPRHGYDLSLAVVPKLTSSVPLAAGIIAGPQAGAVAYLVDKLASSAGVDFNKAAEFEYRITGSWEEPVVELISAVDEPDESTFPAE